MKYGTLLLICWMSLGDRVGYGQSLQPDSAYTFENEHGPLSTAFSVPDSPFRTTLQTPFDFGITCSQWCYIVVKIGASKRAADQVLLIDNTSLDSVLIYQWGEEGSRKLLYMGGTAMRYDDDREVVWHTAPVDNSRQAARYLVALKAPAQNIHVWLEVSPAREVAQAHIRYERLIFTYLGGIGIIFIAAFVSFALLRQRLLLYYAAYIFCTAGWIFAHYGYAFALIYPHFPDLNPAIKPMTSLLALWFLFELVFALVPNIRLHPMLRKTLRALQMAALLLVLVAWYRVVIAYPAVVMLVVNVLWHMVLLMSIVLLLFLLLRLSSGNWVAKLLVIAVSAPLVMSVFQVFSNAGYINSPVLNEHGMMAAQLFEILLLAFVIIYNLYTGQREKETALQLLQGQQRQTLQALIGLQDNERKRIAQDLHDSIGPLLAAIKINVHRLEDMNRSPEELAAIFSQTDAILDDSIAEIRNIAHQLMPKGLSSKGLILLLAEYFKDLEWLYLASVKFEHRVDISLPPDIQLNVYRMICELVLNAAKHGGAKKITVQIDTKREYCLLCVEDNGKGFHVDSPPGSVMGLASMQRRVAYLNGHFDIDSQLATGTRVTIRIPLYIPD